MTDSFFFSYSGDLTNSLQRQMAMGEEKAHLPLWKRVDDRFFFNKYLLQGLIDLDDSRADPFIIPLIQGFVEMQFAPLELEMSPNQVVFSGLDHTSDSEPAVANGLPDFYTIALISRRSRHRAGTLQAGTLESRTLKCLNSKRKLSQARDTNDEESMRKVSLQTTWRPSRSSCTTITVCPL